MNAKRVDAGCNCEKCGKLFTEDCCEYDQASAAYLCPGCRPKPSNAKHTPGPWMHNATKGRNDAVAIWAADDSIAVCTTDFPKHFAESVPPPDICDANARLIAAAPDLLEALRAICDNCASLDPEHLHKFDRYYLAARAAIAKAEGRE